MTTQLDSNGNTAVLQSLPVELLVLIFNQATHNPVRDIDSFCELSPFESINENQTKRACDESLRTKLSLATCSRRFRQICRRFLYEDIRIRHGSSFLADTLENDAELGKYVRRAVLLPEVSEASSISRILRCCPNLQMLYRPREESSWNKSTFTTQINDNTYHLDSDLPSLQRVDWLHCPADAMSVVSQFSPSFWTLPSLKTLSIGADQWRSWHEPHETEEEIPSLRINVQTLRVCSLDAFGPGNRLFMVDLPHLERLVLEKPESMYALFGIAQFGEHIKYLELGLHPEFARYDYLAVLIVYCQNARDLYYPIFTTQPTRGNDPQVMVFSYNMTHVGLNATKPLERITDSEIAQAEGEERRWKTIGAHFDSLCGERSRFRSLEKVTLYGSEWDEYLEDKRFLPYIELLASRGVALVRDDGSVILSSPAHSTS